MRMKMMGFSPFILFIIATMVSNTMTMMTVTETVTELLTDIGTDSPDLTNAPNSSTTGTTTDERTKSPSITTGYPTTVMTGGSTNPQTLSSSPSSSLSTSMITTDETTSQTTASDQTTDQTTTDETIALSSSSLFTELVTNTESTSAMMPSPGTPDSSTPLPTEPLMTSEPRNDPPTEPMRPKTTEPQKVGPVPEPTFPKLGDDVEKVYEFEFAVEERSAGGCSSDDLSTPDCDAFKNDITDQLTSVYQENAAFKSVVVVSLRPGSIIVRHNVSFSYNDMSNEEKSSSAQRIYDQTLGQALAGGKLGNYSVVEDCGDCNTPQDISTICDLESEVNCKVNTKKTCNSEYNYWQCESICDTEYCNGHGICWQPDFNSNPICSCDWTDNHWYWGYECQYYVDQMYLIIGCTCGGVVLIVILVSLCGCLFVKTRQKSEKSKVSSESGDDVIHAFHNLGFSHDTETHFPPIDDIEEGDILQRSRPYSYIYSKPEDNGNGVLKIENGNGAKENGLEAPTNEDATKRLSNGSSDTRHSSFLKSNGDGSQERSQEFWGNLSEPSDAERIKLEPVLDHINVNEPFKIQRPRISANYSYGNTSTAPSATPNVYQDVTHSPSQYLPDPDYATQR